MPNNNARARSAREWRGDGGFAIFSIHLTGSLIRATDGLGPYQTTLRGHARRWRIAIATIAVASTVAIVSTYPVFSQAWDEPAHLAAGMEWLSAGTYRYETAHPPLARVAAAAGPYLAGARTLGQPTLYAEGRALLGSGDHYRRTLFLARLGMLPFFWLLLATCAVWGSSIGGGSGAALATLFAAANPNVLAHAGFVGTDLAPAALVALALFAWMRWRERPVLMRGTVLGAALALALVTKFSALAFLGAGIAAGELFRAVARRRGGEAPLRLGGSLLAAAVAAALVVWAVYGFRIGPVSHGGVPVPAPELFRGLRDFLAHGTGGHPAFLLGEVRVTGWWYYYLVALAVKTPLPLLALAIVGSAAAVRACRGDEGWRALVPLAGVAGVLIPAMFSRADLGVRIVLAAYPFLALLAARGALAGWQGVGSPRARLARRAGIAALAAGIAIVPVRAWPDYLAYFNALAGRHPERVLVDSNLDWGQDLYRLADTVRARRIESLRVHYFGSGSLAAAGLPSARRLGRDERATGYVAASETFLAGVWSDTSLRWLSRRTPVARIGKSMRLYFIEPGGAVP